MAYFDILEKGLVIVFLPHFLNDFLIKMFLMLYSTKWTNCLVAFTSYIAIFCFLGCDVINFEINLIFLMKRFSYMTKTLRAFKVK